MEGVVLIVVMALPLEAALVLPWFGPLRRAAWTILLAL